MPRAGWLAAGAIASAFILPSLIEAAGSAGGGALAGITAGGLVVLAVAVLGCAIALLRGGPIGSAFLVLGSATLAIRIGLTAIGAGTEAGIPFPTGEGTWQATVGDVSSPQRAEQRALLRVTAQTTDGSTALAAGIAYAWLPRFPRIIPGDVIEAEGRAEPARDDGSGFADYLRARGAAGTMRIRSMRLIGHDGGVLGGIERLRWDVDASIAQALPEPEAGLASGILIGLRERVTRDVVDAFTATGLTHVVAISGWNIALVGGIVTGLLRATGIGRRARSTIVLVAIVGYTLLAGAEASVIRAAAMGAVVLLARESGRPSGAAAALGLACWALLLADPAMIGDIGFQLSVAATAGLLVLGGPAERAVQASLRGHGPAWLSESLGVSLAAQLATLPLILVHFGRLSLISPLANLVIAPVVPLAMLGALIAAGVGAVVTAPLAAMLASPVLVAAWLPLAVMVRGADLMATFPLASAELPFPFDLAGAAVALAALVVAVRRARTSMAAARRGAVERSAAHRRPPEAEPARRRLGRALVVAGCGVVVLGATSVALVTRPGGAVVVSVLDVGQGDAILLEADEGTRVLVDGGGDPDLLVRRLDERIPIWDRRIDVVLVTHPHEDHVAGLAGLLPRYRVGVFAENGMRSDGGGYAAFREQAERYGVGIVRLAQGDGFPIGRAHAEVVWPPPGSALETAPDSGRVINDSSLVLDIRIGVERLLLTGDIEDDMDDALVGALDPIEGRLDLLKVAHHGSATATSAELLSALRPRVAVISVGADNDYGHPAPSTLARLEAVGARVLRTDLDGTVVLSFDGAAARVEERASDAAGASAGGSIARGSATTARPVAIVATGWSPCYARSDAGPDAFRGSPAAAGDRALAASHAARDRGRRGRVVPRLPGAGTRRPRRPPPRRDRGAPPRRRQGLPRRRPAEALPARPSRGGVRRGSGTSRARARGREPPRHAPRRG
jgi:competence protein ComEC